MQTRRDGKAGESRIVLRLARSEVRRYWLTLFAISVAVPTMWGLAGAAFAADRQDTERRVRMAAELAAKLTPAKVSEANGIGVVDLPAQPEPVEIRSGEAGDADINLSASALYARRSSGRFFAEGRDEEVPKGARNKVAASSIEDGSDPVASYFEKPSEEWRIVSAMLAGRRALVRNLAAFAGGAAAPPAGTRSAAPESSPGATRTARAEKLAEISAVLPPTPESDTQAMSAGAAASTSSAAEGQAIAREEQVPAADAVVVAPVAPPQQFAHAVTSAENLPEKTFSPVAVSAEPAGDSWTPAAEPLLLADAAAAPEPPQQPAYIGADDPDAAPETDPWSFDSDEDADRPLDRYGDLDSSGSADAPAQQETVLPPAGPVIDGLTPLEPSGSDGAGAADDNFDAGSDEEAVDGPRRRSVFRNAMQEAAANSAATMTAATTTSFASGLDSDRFDLGGALASLADLDLNQTPTLAPGLTISHATISVGYSSSALPYAQSQFRNLGGDTDISARTEIDYFKPLRRGQISASYAPSYSQRSNFPEWNTTNHAARFSLNKALNSRWGWGANANIRNVGLEQFWFDAPIFSAPPVPNTLDDLFSQVEAGSISDDEFAAVLTGSPVVDRPARRNIGLGKTLSGGVSTSAQYAQSRRTRLDFGVSASRHKLIDTPLPLDRNAAFLQTTSTVNGRAGVNHRLSTRMNLLAGFDFGQSDSGLFQSKRAMFRVGFSRRVNRSLSITAASGVGTNNGSYTPGGPEATAFLRPWRATWLASTGVNYAMGRHDVSLSAYRSAGDSLGIASVVSYGATASWRWDPRATAWSFVAGGNVFRSQTGEELLQAGINTAQTDTRSSLFRAGALRRVSPSTALRSDYFFGKYDSPFQGLYSNLAVHRVQASFIWYPFGGRR